MSTPPNRIASARQQSSERVVAPSDASESTHVRRLPTARLRSLVEGDVLDGDILEGDVVEVDQHDTIPCRPPVAEMPARPNDLERTLRFARLVRDTLADDHPLTRLLELALMRRDAALLQGLLKELHRQQTADRTSEDGETPRRADRVTLLPAPPKSA